MQPFTCSCCGQLLFFENSVCLQCGSPLGVDPDGHRLLTLVDTGDAYELLVPDTVGRDGLAAADDTAPGTVVADGPAIGIPVAPTVRYRRCVNQDLARCNWLVPVDDPEALCASCRLTTVRPDDGDTDALAAFADAETAKRRLLAQLGVLGLRVVSRADDPANGLAFEFLSSRNRQVITGHDTGVITLDLSESDDAHREFVRQQLGEPYRTVLGHLRHEIGHYFWPGLVAAHDGHLAEFRDLFGDERISYDDAKAAHYGGDGDGGGGAGGGGGGGAEWPATHVSEYATMHPWEDWAETFAHYLHIHDGLHTARAFGLGVGSPSAEAGRAGLGAPRGLSVEPMVIDWLGLTLALNGMSRSIGEGDHYPFVLPQPVITKLDFVHRCITAATGS